ncbi:hypothetical protein [Nonlabens antarcticus]|uniref:hypothetical protein n=1 Tax=Nonlabens antarcticus TaxID=392714 RepID=UPI0018917F6E|nr:hypothetical protein [Nonlabens antarcticus]
MKNLFFAVVFGLAAFSASANNHEIKINNFDKMDDPIEVKAQVEINLTSIENEELTKEYTGRCLDGHSFPVEAENREDAQAYVNAYCRGRKEVKTTIAPPSRPWNML